MIDIHNCKNIFTKYVNNYDINNPKIMSKYNHTFRVMENAKLIAEDLNLSKEEVKLAMLIGLLHDIGRFEQAILFDSYASNVPFDHGTYGVDVLKKNNFINEFVNSKDIQAIVLTAVNNHNKYKIEDGLDEETNMYCKIIRDADKLDIFNREKNIEKEITNSSISKEVLNSFLNNELVIDKNIKTDLDFDLRHIAMVYDLNYQYTKNYLIKENIIDIVIDKLINANKNEQDNLNIIRNNINIYLKGDKNVR